MLTLSRRQISVPFEWAASYLAPQATHERAPHIKVGDAVRVMHGPERHRQGLVVARYQHGAILSLTDLRMKVTVSLVRLVFTFLDSLVSTSSFLSNRTM